MFLKQNPKEGSNIIDLITRILDLLKEEFIDTC